MNKQVRVVTITDADSYVKWGAALSSRMPAEWNVSLVVIANPVMPSDGQLTAALTGTKFEHPPVLDLPALKTFLRDAAPDLVLVSVRGALVKVIVRAIVTSVERRPVLVSGLPGISIPATRMAVAHRSQTDLLVLHSRREIHAFGRLAKAMRVEQTFGLATLPFLPRRAVGSRPDGDVIFAAQAKVPLTREDRVALLNWLAESARRHPWRRIVIKLRAAPGEAQTHPEKWEYASLVGDLDRALPRNLIFAGGSMRDHLSGAAALVTVSSTAAIEAIAMNVPVLAINDFGVRGDLINTVFTDSGLFGDSADLVQARFKHPNPAWLDENYFHDASAENWVALAEDLLEQREAGTLPVKELARGSAGGALRRAWDRKRALGSHDRTVSGMLALLIGTVPRLVLRTFRSMRAARRMARPVALQPVREPLEDVAVPLQRGQRPVVTPRGEVIQLVRNSPRGE
ncbi:hypothetical protein BH09ACT1_BH09ACT1_24570 [soil metagenome]